MIPKGGCSPELRHSRKPSWAALPERPRFFIGQNRCPKAACWRQEALAGASPRRAWGQARPLPRPPWQGPPRHPLPWGDRANPNDGYTPCSLPLQQPRNEPFARPPSFSGQRSPLAAQSAAVSSTPTPAATPAWVPLSHIPPLPPMPPLPPTLCPKVQGPLSLLPPPLAHPSATHQLLP